MITGIKEKLINLEVIYDNTYADMYEKLIVDNIQTAEIKYETHKHHIVPRYYFKINNLPIDNSSENLVNLHFSKHILAHYYLYKCAKPNFIKSQEEAILFLCNQQTIEEALKIIAQDDLDQIYKDLMIRRSNLYKGTTRPQYVKDKIAKSLKGKEKTQEHRNKLSITKMGENNPNYGKHWTEDRKNQFHENWSEMNSPNYGRTASEETKRKNSLAHMGQNHPNYGKNLSDITKKRISEALTGKAKSKEHRQALSDAKLGKANLKARGKKRSVESRQKMSDSHKGIKHTEEWKTNLSKRNSGTGNPNFGKKWYHNSEEQIMIRQEDIPYYESLGYLKGKLPHSEEHKQHLRDAWKNKQL